MANATIQLSDNGTSINPATVKSVAWELMDGTEVTSGSIAASTSESPSKTQADVHYKMESADPTQRCALCQHYLGAGMCDWVMGEPQGIMEDGTCDSFSALEASVVPEMTPPASVVVAEQTDNSGYIALKIDWEYQIERIQNALYLLFGYDDAWSWNDPWTYHISLAYSNNVTDAQLLESVKGVIGSQVIDLHFSAIDVFETPDGLAVYAKIDPNDALSALQKTIADSLIAQGVELSPFSLSEGWVAHLTMATAPAGTPVPQTVIDFQAYADTICITRSGYTSIAELPLTWAQAMPVIEDGLGPVAEMATASWKVGASSDLPLMEGDSAWDGTAAKKSLFEAAGFGTDTVDTALARKGFLLYNASAPRLRGSYKVPVAQMVNGEMKVSKEGLRAAASRLPQVKGVGQDVIDRAQNILNSYEKKAGIGEMANQPTSIRLTMISEMRGAYPKIALPGGINLAEIETITGEKPFFVTLPIGQAGARSNNGRTYTRSAVEQMVEQVNANRPYGAWGHLTQEEAATRFDPPAVQWLAAMLDDKGVAWGKLIPLNKETRDYYRLAGATNSKVATSLTALAEMQQDNVVGMDLITIDIAEPARVGVPQAVGSPELTAEMSGAGDVYTRARAESLVTPVPIYEHKEGIVEPIQELTQERDALKGQVGTLTTQVTELTGKVTELTGEKTQLAEATLILRTQVGTLLKEYVGAAVAKKVTIEAARPIISEFVAAKQPSSKEDIDKAVDAVLERPEVAEMLKVMLVSAAGPAIPAARDVNKGSNTEPVWELPADSERESA